MSVISKEEYEEYATLCASGGERIMDLISLFMKSDFKQTLQAPGSVSVSSRTKTYESAKEKAAKDKVPFTLAGISEKFHDISGIRVATLTLDDVYAFRDKVKDFCDKQKEREQLGGAAMLWLEKEKDYYKKPKKSGYRGVHLILKVRAISGEIVRAELQIRSKFTDAWSEYEHALCYKNPNASDEERQRLKIAAEKLYKEDLRLTKLLTETS